MGATAARLRRVPGARKAQPGPAHEQPLYPAARSRGAESVGHGQPESPEAPYARRLSSGETSGKSPAARISRHREQGTAPLPTLGAGAARGRSLRVTARRPRGKRGGPGAPWRREGVPSEFTASTDLGGNEQGRAVLNERGTVTSAPCSADPGHEPELGRCAAAPPRSRSILSPSVAPMLEFEPASLPPRRARAEPGPQPPRSAPPSPTATGPRAALPPGAVPRDPHRAAQIPGSAPHAAPVSVPGPRDASFPEHGGCRGPGSRARARRVPLLGLRPRGQSDGRQQRRHRHGARTGRRFRSGTAGSGGRRAAPHRPAPRPRVSGEKQRRRRGTTGRAPRRAQG